MQCKRKEKWQRIDGKLFSILVSPLISDIEKTKVEKSVITDLLVLKICILLVVVIENDAPPRYYQKNILLLLTFSLDLPAAERCHEPYDSYGPSFSLDHQLLLLLLLLLAYSCGRRKYSWKIVFCKKIEKGYPWTSEYIYKYINIYKYICKIESI